MGAEIIHNMGFTHVSTGVFQLPLVEGPVLPAILRADNPFEELVSALAQKKGSVRLCESGATVLVRTLNPLLGAVEKDVMTRWTDKINTSYLEALVNASVEGGHPLRMEHFAYDMSRFYGAKTVAKKLHKTADLKKLMKAVNAEFATATGIANDPS
jgi:hypothetical protein